MEVYSACGGGVLFLNSKVRVLLLFRPVNEHSLFVKQPRTFEQEKV